MLVQELLKERNKLLRRERKLMDKINKQIQEMRKYLNTPRLKSIVQKFLELVEELEVTQKSVAEIEEEILNAAQNCDCG